MAEQVSSGIGHSPRDYARSARDEHQWMHDRAKGQISANPCSWEPSINLKRPFARYSGIPHFVHPQEETEKHTSTSVPNGQALLSNADTSGLSAKEATEFEIAERLMNDATRPNFGEVVTNFRAGVDIERVMENNERLKPSYMIVDNVLPYWENLFRNEMDDCLGILEQRLNHFRAIGYAEMSVSEFAYRIGWYRRSRPIQRYLWFMPNLIHQKRLKDKDSMIAWKTEAEAGHYTFEPQLGRGPVPPWGDA